MIQFGSTIPKPNQIITRQDTSRNFAKHICGKNAYTWKSQNWPLVRVLNSCLKTPYHQTYIYSLERGIVCIIVISHTWATSLPPPSPPNSGLSNPLDSVPVKGVFLGRLGAIISSDNPVAIGLTNPTKVRVFSYVALGAAFLFHHLMITTSLLHLEFE